MIDKLMTDTQIYTDMQGLEELKVEANTDKSQAIKHVAQQFEAIMMQMVLSSMRAANHAFSDEESSEQMDMYQEMFDKQLTLSLSKEGTGFASLIEKNLAPRIHPTEPAKELIHDTSVSHTVTINPTPPKLSASPAQFISHLWDAAKAAAHKLAIHPAVLIAQAALETNWGKNVIASATAGSSYNLFNIKADGKWQKGKVTAVTLEQQNDTLIKSTADFRQYHSFNESLQDYVEFLKHNPRYQAALQLTHDAKQFLQALQHAGFATDKRYAEKVLNVLNSKEFKEGLEKIDINLSS